VYGFGGVGKTSLLQESIQQLLNERAAKPERHTFDAFIWISAQARIYTADGPMSTPHPAQTLEDIFAAISIGLNQRGIASADPSLQHDLILNALSGQRTLLAIDNFEELHDDRIRTFIDQVPLSTKVVITTRLQIDGATNINLKRMTRGEGLALIHEECNVKGVTLTEQQREELYEGTDGLPLAIVISVSLMSYGHTVQNVLHTIASAKGDISEYLFANTIESLSKDNSHLLLLALSFFATGATTRGLGEVAYGRSVPEHLCEERVVKLDRLSLVEVTNSRLTMRPLTRRFAAAQLSGRRKWEIAARDRWAQHLAGQVEESAKCATHTEMFAYLDQERENLFALFEWAAVHKDTNGCLLAADALRTVSRYLYAHGFWSQLLSYIPWATDALLANEKMQAYLILLLGWPVRIYLHQENTDSIHRSFAIARAELSKRNMEGNFESALVNLYWASVMRRQGESEEVVPLLQKTIKTFGAVDRPRWTATALLKLGDTLIHLRRYEAAKSCFKRINVICSQQRTHAPWITEDVALANANLGIIDNASGDFKNAIVKLRLAEPQLTSLPDRIILMMECAIAEYNLGNRREAQRLGSCARELADKLGFRGPLSESNPNLQENVILKG
jgi:tetratricopeptide (TPR) repeat protein